jgi:hypothetical protein
MGDVTVLNIESWVKSPLLSTENCQGIDGLDTMMSHPPIASHFLKPEAPCQGWSGAESEASLDMEVA